MMKKVKKDNRAYLVLLVVLIVMVLFVIWNTARFDLFKPKISSITISEEEYGSLMSAFEKYDGLKLESAFCVNGNIWGGVANIKSVTVPYQERNQYSVVVDRCKNFNNIGIIHIQPLGYCDLSETDYYSFGEAKVRVIGIVCGVGDVKIYSYENLYEPLEIKVYK